MILTITLKAFRDAVFRSLLCKIGIVVTNSILCLWHKIIFRVVIANSFLKMGRRSMAEDYGTSYLQSPATAHGLDQDQLI